MNVETLRHVPLFESLDTEAAHELCELLESQDIYDNHFLDSPAWRAARPPHDDAD